MERYKREHNFKSPKRLFSASVLLDGAVSLTKAAFFWCSVMIGLLVVSNALYIALELAGVKL